MLFNYGAKQHECQQFIEISIKEIVAQCETMAPHYRKIGNYLFGLSNSCRKVFPGRTYLARAVGVSVSTVNRAFRLFERMGLIKRTSRSNRSNVFAFSPKLADEHVRFSLRPFFKALSVIPIALNLLLSPLRDNKQKNLSNCIVSDVLILKEDIYIYKNKAKANSESIHVRARVGEADFASIFKKENDMNEFKREGSVIPDSVKKCGLHLTPIGEADLARYPDEAIKYAIGQLSTAKGVSDPFRYVCKIAHSWCRDKVVKPDHAFANRHFELLSAEASSPRLVDIDLSDIVARSPKKEVKASAVGHTVSGDQSYVRQLHPEYVPEEIVGSEKDREYYDNFEQQESTRILLSLGVPLANIKTMTGNFKKNLGLE